MLNNLNKIFKGFILVFFSLVFFCFPNNSFGQDDYLDYTEETLEGEVIKVVSQEEIVPEGSDRPQIFQELEVLVKKGSLDGRRVIIENGNISLSNPMVYKEGDELVITYGKNFAGEDSFYITDYVRRTPLFILFLLFCFVAVFVGKLKGLTSLLGMAISFMVIFIYILPQISAGAKPLPVAIFGSIIIIPLSFYLSHGLNKKTSIAIAGTIISLVITGILASFFVEFTRLTGFASEEAGFLHSFASGRVIDIKNLLLAGIIIGVLGVLDDVTVSQSAIVSELKKTDPKLKAYQLYKKAMSVGKDHIASMVNTLILVYAGAALPLLLLFIDSPRPFTEVVNYEIIADEVVRTLVASIGLMLAVPITTFIAAFISDREKR